ncbi:tyrosine/serine/threonine protein phosphatase pps1 [Puccinia graminis f. sp. tritici]|uniref:Tyrosine/serine/threonine protein phosphatase pps1 n=1 Tax=Puccinia graminis f. sp. tritici TaxID=56615 RepID=A0A5B0NBH4_PUCGR|nr:tyrosine/serine/threonine protein phosphatase pps1 [Puccinia graminis f. sp. tritici]KAA1130613.1 tyrosine/serine/threonine protein phosphatase pps1 [Puccinia graminis f. sp. tritici]
MDSLQCLSASPLIEANAAIPSHLHPVALRSTTSATSPRIAAASKLVEAQLRASHASSPSISASSVPSPAEESQLPDSSPDTKLNSSSTPASGHSSRPGLLLHDVAGLTIENHTDDETNSRAPDAIAGLQLNSKRFPLLSSVRTPQAARSAPADDPTQSIRMVSCAEFAEIHDAYMASVSRVDESVVFPWLHCCGVPGTPQAAYFSESPHARNAPRYRGLTIVSADSEPAPRSMARASPIASVNTTDSSFESKTRDRARTRSLGASSTKSSTSLESSATASTSSSYTGIDSVATTPTSPSTSVVSFDGPEPRASLLRSSLLPHDILERCPHSGQYMGFFASPRLPPTVNLRLFRQQPSRYATISDIVVYSEAGMSDDAIALAQLIRIAQDQCFHSRGGHAANAIEYNVYIVSEPFEVFERDFSHVVAVDGWGYRRNKIDFFEREREEMAALTRATEISDNVWLGNSAGVPLPKEDASTSCQRAAFDERPPTVTSHLAKADEHGNAPFDVCIEAHDQAAITSSLQFHLNQNYLDRIKQRAKNDNDSDLAEIIHMEVPSTGQSCSGALSRDKLVRYLVDLCAWVKKIAKPADTPGRLGRKVLIHCHDGYTETSLFALSYIMYDLGCTLPEAYLHLQNDQNRSFFVYPADVPLLRRVETRIEQELTEQRKAQMHRMTIDEPSRNLFLRGCVSFGTSSAQHTKSSVTPPLTSCAPSTPRPARSQHPWFYDSRFDGHFPSRILPFVYLGNLNHASNALMLKALGITHVVSMGESALVPPPQNSRFISPFTNASQSNVVNSLWHECASGQIDVLDMKGVADDGIDSIRPHIERAMEFIEKCRLAGGKVLVHCRVGVSRSATIVIGYVMKHLKMDLASAYLMVRSRRLNILIQPNLLFMWGLKRLESDMVANAKPHKDAEDSDCQANHFELRKRRMLSWSFLSREIADLNHRYLC